MAEFTRLTNKLICRGIQLSRPVDLLSDGKFAILKNVRSYQDGQLQCRPGSSALNAMAALDQLNVHSVRRLTDLLPGASFAFIRVVGAGTKLYAGVTPTAPAILTGFSGNPLSLIPYRPPQSPESWMYVGDSLKMAKVKPDGSGTQNMGGAPPQQAPTSSLRGINTGVDLVYLNMGASTNGGTAGATSTPNRVNTSIAANGILFDSGTTGWAYIAPSAFTADIQEGILVVVNTGGGTAETVLIESIQRTSVLGTTTIAAILYDAGTTGLCTVQLSIPNPLIERNSLLRFAGGTPETVRVLSITMGPDGLSSIRCSTVNTHAAGESITGFVSFRAYCLNTHAAGETLTSVSVQSTITTGTGYLNLATAFNLAQINGRPVGPDDPLHISVWLDKPENLTEGRILLDFDAAGGGAGTVFTQNFFYRAFRTSDLNAAATGTSTVLTSTQQAVQRLLVSGIPQTNPANSVPIEVLQQLFPDLPQAQLRQAGSQLSAQDIQDALQSFADANNIPPAPSAPDSGTGQVVSDQTNDGASQWTEFVINIGDLVRVGADGSRGLKDIGAIRVQFTVTASTIIRIDSWTLRGTYGPDVVGVGQPLAYRCRGRSTSTGAVTNPSPATRYGETPRRNRVVVNPAQIADAQFDKIDIERFGGVNPGWHYLGSCDNGAAPSFNDDYDDAAIQGADPLDLDNYQPFPMTDKPKSGTCNVAGTAVKWVSGDTFNTSWAPGTIININGIDYELYSSPATTTFLETVENVGALTGVKWFILEPILMGQPLPHLWGPHPSIDVIFGCKSPYQPGTLFWTKGGNADSAPITYQQDACPPTESLLNGVMLPDGRSFVWSDQRYFAIYPSLNDLSKMTIIEAGKRGLYLEHVLCSGEGKLWWRVAEGIVESDGGGDGQSITDDDLLPLFPHDGQPGVAVNGYNPPDDTQPQRLSYENGWVLFDYADTLGAKKRLSYHVRTKSWWPDDYGALGVLMAYKEEGQGVNSVLFGGSDGKLYVSGGTQDNGVDIPWQWRTGSGDGGDPRPNKEWGDTLLDLNTAGIDVTITPGFDNYATLLAPTVINNNARPKQDFPRISFGQDVGQFARNLALDAVIAKSGPLFYAWMPSLGLIPEFVVDFLGEATTHGSSDFQILGPQAYFSVIATADVTLTITVDGKASAVTIPNNAGVQSKQLVPLPAGLKGLLYAYRFSSPQRFRLFKAECSVAVKRWGDSGPFQWVNPFGQESRLRGMT